MRAGMRIAVSGLHAAQTSLDVRAHNLANLATEGFDASRVTLRAVQPLGGVEVDSVAPGAPGSGVDLTTEVVGVISARALYDVNARLLRAQVENDRSLLDVLA